jgi:hypothetical protein
MPYTLEYNRALNIIELVYTGRYTPQESRESTSKAIALGKEHGDADALVDATEAKLEVSIFDLFDLPDRQYVAQDMKRKIRIAVIPPRRPEDQEAARFYETACFNRGWQVRLFPDRDDAIEWLKGTDSPNRPDADDA